MEYFAHAHTVCTRPSLHFFGEGPGYEAKVDHEIIEVNGLVPLPNCCTS